MKRVQICKLQPGQWFLYENEKWLVGVSKHPSPRKAIFVRNANIGFFDADALVTPIKVQIRIVRNERPK